MRNGLPISRNQRQSQKHISSKGKRTWSTLYSSCNSGLQGLYRSVILRGELARTSVLSTLCIVLRLAHASVLSTLCIVLRLACTNFHALSIKVNALNSTCWTFTLTLLGFNESATLKIMLPVGGVKIDGSFFPHQSDTEAWDDDDVGSTSHVTFFSPECLITWWNHLIVWTTIDLGNAFFSNWVEQDLSYNRWCHQCHHLVVSWPSCLNYLLVKQAVVCPAAAAIHECERNSMDFYPNVKFQVSWDNTQYIPKLYHHNYQSIVDPRNKIIFFLVRNLCGLFKFLCLRNLSWSNQAMEPWRVVARILWGPYHI